MQSANLQVDLHLLQYLLRPLVVLPMSLVPYLALTLALLLTLLAAARVQGGTRWPRTVSGLETQPVAQCMAAGWILI